MIPRAVLSLCLSLLLAESALGVTQNTRNSPTLVYPADGALVGRQVMVRIGFAGKGPQGLAEDSGIVMDAGPADQAWNIGDRSSAEGSAHSGPADGTGLIQTADLRPKGPHFALLIDAPAPLPGDPFQADSHHVPFPVGNPQMTLTLSPGPHLLALVRLNGNGQVSRRYYEQAPTSITVR